MRLALILFFLLVPALAMAQTNKPSLTNMDCMIVQAALGSLDWEGEPLVPLFHAPSEMPPSRPANARAYRFSSTVLLHIVEDADALQKNLALLQETQRKFISTNAPKADAAKPKQDPTTQAAIDSNWNDLLHQSCTVPLVHLKWADLSGDAKDPNEFPPSVLQPLLPIIDK